MPKGAVMLSEIRRAKLLASCEQCGRRVQYDRQAMLDAGGDRGLPDLIVQIARRLGCEKASPSNVSLYDQCELRFTHLR